MELRCLLITELTQFFLCDSMCVVCDSPISHALQGTFRDAQNSLYSNDLHNNTIKHGNQHLENEAAVAADKSTLARRVCVVPSTG